MATYYVAKTGSDSNPGTLASPFLTVVKGVSVLVAGDTLNVRSGTYIEQVLVSQSGNAGAHITIAGYPGDDFILDGNNTIPAGFSGLMRATGSYVDFKDFTVQKSFYVGFLLDGPFETVTNCLSTLNWENGMLMRGHDCIVQDSRAFYNCTANDLGQNKRGYWATGISSARTTPLAANNIIRRNTIRNTWGESCSSFETTGTTIEDNVIYDNLLNIYISDTRFVLCQRNLSYTTVGNIVGQYHQVGTAGTEKRRQGGLTLFDEAQLVGGSNDNTIINNMFLGNAWNIASFIPLRNVLVAYNTFVNIVTAPGNTQSDANIVFGSSGHFGSQISNNIVLQEDSQALILISSATGINLNHNLWSKAHPANANGTGDITADPQLTKEGPTGPGLLTGNYFKIKSTSPARNAGAALSQVTVDYFKTLRGSAPDIGAYEYTTSAGQQFWLL